MLFPINQSLLDSVAASQRQITLDLGFSPPGPFLLYSPALSRRTSLAFAYLSISPPAFILGPVELFVSATLPLLLRCGQPIRPCTGVRRRRLTLHPPGTAS